MKSDDVILLAHGGGGVLTSRLIGEIILRHLGNPILRQMDDAAVLPEPEGRLVFTTDSYVVSPLFFPGGDIGRLAVCGTVNDLAMQGARPRHLSLSLIIEEGFAVADLDRVIASVAVAAREADVTVVTGDTKVVDRGHGNGIYINTAGVGALPEGVDVHVGNARPGDVVIVTGTLGDHGMAIMSRREGLEFESTIESDAAPLADLTARLLEAVRTVRCLRDPTRGGLTGALCDIAERSGVGVRIREADLPIQPDVGAACELLGIDPLDVANEGKAVIVCPPDRADAALEVVRAHRLGGAARVIGTIDEEPSGMTVLQTRIGGERILEPATGDQLPRIC